MKLIKRADTKIKKNCVKWVKEHGFEDLLMVVDSPPPSNISAKDRWVFGVIKDNFGKTSQSSVLCYDVGGSNKYKWSSITIEEYLEALVEWDYEEQAIVHIQRAIIAATGMSDRKFCRKLKIRKRRLKTWVQNEPRIIPTRKIKKIYEIIKKEGSIPQ